MKYDKYSYEKMKSLDWTKSVTALAKEVGCSRQHFYTLKEKYENEINAGKEKVRVQQMEKELKECKAKLKALEK